MSCLHKGADVLAQQLCIANDEVAVLAHGEVGVAEVGA